MKIKATDGMRLDAGINVDVKHRAGGEELACITIDNTIAAVWMDDVQLDALACAIGAARMELRSRRRKENRP